MQWLIDIIADRIMQNFSGMIVAWSGAIVDIPDGWVLCDGNNSSPDLRDKFVVGSGSTYAPDDSGGSVNHQHTFTTDGHSHPLTAGKGIGTGLDYYPTTLTRTDTGTTNNGSSLPPYFSLAYIMKV